MAAGAAITVAGFMVALASHSEAPLPARLDRAAWASLLGLAWLAAAIGNVARLRFGSAEEIGGDAGSAAGPMVANANAVVRNTAEQVLLALPIYWLLAWADPGSHALILLLAGSFSVGRTLFWTGYATGAKARALGFALTFYPHVGALLWLTVVLADRAS